MNWIVETFRRHFRPLEPIPPDSEVLEYFGSLPLTRPAWTSEIRAVLFDLYGTLWISSSGQVEHSRKRIPAEAMLQALHAVGLRPVRWTDTEAKILFEVIDAMHAQRCNEGVEYPEISMADAWQRTIQELDRRGLLPQTEIHSLDPSRLVIEFEARANPLWPMPGAERCLARLRQQGYRLGIVSNAQFYTPCVFLALFGAKAEDVGFAPQLTFYSYAYGLAKPGLSLFQWAKEELAHGQIAPQQTLYLGNDMLHDVWPAAQIGFRTVLFAGDQRSLRLRSDDPRTASLRPDAVITSLDQLADWLCALPPPEQNSS